jgi:hypothetical protein
MKRDMDLARDILHKLEAVDAGAGVPASAFPGFTNQVVACHFKLLQEAGYIEANLYEIEELGPLDGSAQRLRWDGYEFLDATRNATVWQRLKKKVVEEGGSLPFTVVKELGLLYVKQQVGLRDA